jgi:hypothetical protein
VGLQMTKYELSDGNSFPHLVLTNFCEGTDQFVYTYHPQSGLSVN